MEIRYQDVETKEWTEAEFDPETPGCPRCNTEMWDNRKNKRNPKAPDFKCKDKACNQAVWLPKPKSAPKPQLAPTPKPVSKETPKEKVDWDKISEGKVRHHFALEAYKMGKELNEGLVIEIDCWVNYVMTGKLE